MSQDGPRKIPVKRESPEEKVFAQSHQDDVKGLLKIVTFKPVKKSDIERNPRILGPRFVD